VVNLVLLTEVYKLRTTRGKQRYSLREIFLNRDHVITIREDKRLSEEFAKGYMPIELDEDQSFTKIVLSGASASSGVAVIGTVYAVAEKVGKR